MDIGDRINDRYKIKGMVGIGGMARVYLARDLILDRDVAVKTLAYNFENEEDGLRRFKREALSTTELVHPNIVNIYDVEEDGTPYIVMEYVKGTDLKEYILNNHPIPYRKAISIMEQILDAIAYAHENNIIHRDIKPQNILLDENGTVKITDFGIAVALSQNSITQTNSLLGSVHYLSPEQARGSVVTKKADIYSLGIVLFELLTGDVPFSGESAVSIALKHFQSPIPELKEIDSRIPQPLENVVLKATAKDPNQRYETVAEMKADLSTSLAIDRSKEKRFVPKDINDDETKMLTPINPDKAGKIAEDEAETNSDQSEKTPAPSKKKKKKWPWLILIVILFVSIFLYFYPFGPSEVAVPEVEGQTLEQTERELEEFNLYLGEVFEVTSEEYDEGIIIDSNPNPGATIREEQEVNLYVSTGEAEYSLGDYENESFEEIRAQLTELGFTVESEEVNSESVTAGNIVSQDVEAGSDVVPSETTITFEVSAGPAGFSFRDLSGYSRPGVDAYIEEYGLNLTVEEASSDTVPEGQVISQEPEAGRTIYSDSRVTVTFSTGPEERELQEFSQLVTIPYNSETENGEESSESENSSSENEESSESESNEENSGASEEGSSEESTDNSAVNDVQIYISDSERDGEEPVHEFEMSEQTQLLLNFTVEEGDSASYRIVRDGETIEEETVEP